MDRNEALDCASCTLYPRVQPPVPRPRVSTRDALGTRTSESILRSAGVYNVFHHGAASRCPGKAVEPNPEPRQAGSRLCLIRVRYRSRVRSSRNPRLAVLARWRSSHPLLGYHRGRGITSEPAANVHVMRQCFVRLQVKVGRSVDRRRPVQGATAGESFMSLRSTSADRPQSRFDQQLRRSRR